MLFEIVSNLFDAQEFGKSTNVFLRKCIAIDPIGYIDVAIRFCLFVRMASKQSNQYNPLFFVKRLKLTEMLKNGTLFHVAIIAYFVDIVCNVRFVGE